MQEERFDESRGRRSAVDLTRAVAFGLTGIDVDRREDGAGNAPFRTAAISALLTHCRADARFCDAAVEFARELFKRSAKGATDRELASMWKTDYRVEEIYSRKTASSRDSATDYQWLYGGCDASVAQFQRSSDGSDVDPRQRLHAALKRTVDRHADAHRSDPRCGRIFAVSPPSIAAMRMQVRCQACAQIDRSALPCAHRQPNIVDGCVLLQDFDLLAILGVDAEFRMRRGMLEHLKGDASSSDDDGFLIRAMVRKLVDSRFGECGDRTITTQDGASGVELQLEQIFSESGRRDRDEAIRSAAQRKRSKAFVPGLDAIRNSGHLLQPVRQFLPPCLAAIYDECASPEFARRHPRYVERMLALQFLLRAFDGDVGETREAWKPFFRNHQRDGFRQMLDRDDGSFQRCKYGDRQIEDAASCLARGSPWGCQSAAKNGVCPYEKLRASVAKGDFEKNSAFDSFLEHESRRTSAGSGSLPSLKALLLEELRGAAKFGPDFDRAACQSRVASISGKRGAVVGCPFGFYHLAFGDRDAQQRSDASRTEK